MVTLCGGASCGDRDRRRAVHWLLSGTLLIAVGCSGGSSSDAETGEQGAAAAKTSTTSRPAATSTTQPPATDEEALQIVDDLVGEAREISDRLVQNPVSTDTDSRDLVRLKEIYTEDSPDLAGVLSRVDELADEGHRLQAGSSGVYSEQVVFDLEPVDADEIEFRVCALFDVEQVDASGAVVDREAIPILGTGWAYRVEGVWRFYGLQADPDLGDLEPGDVPSGYRFCEEVYGPGEEVAG